MMENKYIIDSHRTCLPLITTKQPRCFWNNMFAFRENRRFLSTNEKPAELNFSKRKLKDSRFCSNWYLTLRHSRRGVCLLIFCLSFRTKKTKKWPPKNHPHPRLKLRWTLRSSKQHTQRYPQLFPRTENLFFSTKLQEIITTRSPANPLGWGKYASGPTCSLVPALSSLYPVAIQFISQYLGGLL